MNVFSLGALAISAYMYYLEYSKEQSPDKTAPWQSALSLSESAANRKVVLLEQQLNQVEVNFKNLSAQIKTLEDKILLKSLRFGH